MTDHRDLAQGPGRTNRIAERCGSSKSVAHNGGR